MLSYINRYRDPKDFPVSTSHLNKWQTVLNEPSHVHLNKLSDQFLIFKNLIFLYLECLNKHHNESYTLEYFLHSLGMTKTILSQNYMKSNKRILLIRIFIEFKCTSLNKQS